MSTYLSSEQIRSIPETGIVKCASAAEAQMYAANDANLMAIRYISGGDLVHAAVSKADLLKATQRKKGECA
jgi:hypothetical protein